MPEIIIVLPAYNEMENVEKLVSRWVALDEELSDKFNLALKIVIVDDGSADDTAVIGKRLAEELANVTIISHDVNKGLGAALKTGVMYSLSERLDSAFVCVMDCDNTHNPAYVIKMLENQKSTSSDVVIASRYRKNAKTKGVNGIRLMASGGARYMFSALLGVKGVRDYTCGYRLYTREILERANKRFGGDMITENGFTCMVEFLYKLHKCGAIFAEIPFELRYDFKEGKSKMKVFRTAVNSIALVFRLKKIK